MFNITGHLCLMSFDVLLICVFNDGVFDAVRYGNVRTGINHCSSCNDLHSVGVVQCFLARTAICFFFFFVVVVLFLLFSSNRCSVL